MARRGGVMRALAGALALMAALSLSACSGANSPADSSSTPVASPSLPAGFPSDEVPVPADFALVNSMVVKVDGEEQFVMTYRKPGDDADAVRGYLGELKNSGFELGDGYPDSSEVNGGVWVLSSKKWKVGVAARVEGDSTDLVLKVDSD